MSTTAHENLEEGTAFTPNFNAEGLLPCITIAANGGEVLMLAYMNPEALEATLRTGIVHYWSRSRQTLWRKGDTSGQTQHVVEIRTDCDQDAILVSVKVDGDGHCCHTGRHSCFYRRYDAKDRHLSFVENPLA